MRIAQIAPIIERTPPTQYGGTERIVSTLTEELVARGHAVTLFATGDSLTSGKLISTYPHALRDSMSPYSMQSTAWSLRHIALAYAQQDNFDIIHDHTGWLGAPIAHTSKTPVVMTLHQAFTEERIAMFESMSRPYLVSISDSQRKLAPDLNYISTVYNGLSMKDYPFSPQNKGYLLFVGRFCEEKSPHYAIEVAQRLNLPLIMAAKLEAGESQKYFDKYIKPHLSKTIRWIGEVKEEERNRLYRDALCFLHPISWDEPFGLTLIESMACGTPVIAFNKGAIPEVIKDGKTGFIVENVDEMTQAVAKIATIDRNECRNYVLKQFTVDRMVSNYELIYQALAAGKSQRKTQMKNRFQRPFLPKRTD